MLGVPSIKIIRRQSWLAIKGISPDKRLLALVQHFVVSLTSATFLASPYDNLSSPYKTAGELDLASLCMY